MKENDIYNEELQEAEEEIKDAEIGRENAFEELKNACNSVIRAEAKLTMERLNLQALKNKIYEEHI